MESTTPFLSVTDAAKVVGVSRRVAYRLVRDHELPHVIVGGRIRVPAGALQRRLAQLEEEALRAVRSA